MGDPKPAELSRPPAMPPPESGYRCAQGCRLDLVDNCFWYLGDIGALANVRFAPGFDGDRQSGSFVIERNRDRLSTCKFDVGVFTQARVLQRRRTIRLRLA